MKKLFGTVPTDGERTALPFVKGGLAKTDVDAAKAAGIRTTNYFGVVGYVKPTAGGSNKAKS